MDSVTGIWTGLLEALGTILRFFHDVTVGVVGEYSWVAAIILLTIAVRMVMLPLAVKQFRSMQAMQQLRPQMKKVQQKYKTDRGMMRTDPEKYRERRQKQQEELMALYKENNVNPASSCLPLVAQMPVFIALFSVLRSETVIPELVDAPFFSATLQMPANEAGIAAIVLLVAMGVTTYVQQKQMMGRNVALADDQQMQQQKIMMYVMPVFLTFLGFNLPVGVLIYWVTTNLWQTTQQWFMLREVADPSTSPSSGSGDSGGGQDGPKRGPTGSDGVSKDRSTGRRDGSSDAGRGRGSGRGSGTSGRNGAGSGRKSGRDAAARQKGASAARTRRNGSKGDAGGNGHRPGRPGSVSRKRNETGDKRR